MRPSLTSCRSELCVAYRAYRQLLIGFVVQELLVTCDASHKVSPTPIPVYPNVSLMLAWSPFQNNARTGCGRKQKPDPVGLSAFARRVQHRGCMVASRLSRALTHRQQQELEQLRQGGRQSREMPLLSALVTPAHRCDEYPSFASAGRPTAPIGGTPQREETGAGNAEPDGVVIRGGNYQEASRLEGPPTVAGKTMTGAKSGERLSLSPLPSSVGVAVVTAASNDASAFDGELGGSGLSPTPVEAVKLGVAEVIGDRGGDGASEDALHEHGLVTRVWRESDGGDVNDREASEGQTGVPRGVGGMGGEGERAGDGEEGEEAEDESLAEHYDPAM